MKIAHMVSTFPPRVGGTGQVCFEEAQRLSIKGHDVTVFTPQYQDSRFDIDCNFKLVYIRPYLKSANSAWMPQLLWKLKGFDVVHLHFPFYGSAHLAWLASKLFKQKYVITYHMDVQVSGWQSYIKSVCDLVWARKILAGAEQVICVDKDHFNQTEFKIHVKKEKLVEIYNSVDTQVFKPRAVEDCDFDNKIPDRFKYKPKILFVGNLLPFKRFDLLLHALIKIKDEQPIVLVVGGGYDLEKYKKMAKELNIQDRILFCGFCNDREQLSKYYSLADCLVVSSDSGESFSLVAIEALSCSCPVVASDIPGVRERVQDGHTGFIFKSGSVEDLAEKLEKFLSLPDEQKQIMGQRGREDAIRKYSWQGHIGKLEDVYKKV
ncbi:MAG: glycosyltransferase family 4 protein [bacterium]